MNAGLKKTYLEEYFYPFFKSWKIAYQTFNTIEEKASHGFKIFSSWLFYQTSNQIYFLHMFIFNKVSTNYFSYQSVENNTMIVRKMYSISPYNLILQECL